jgi:hypothetical protein
MNINSASGDDLAFAQMKLGIPRLIPAVKACLYMSEISGKKDDRHPLHGCAEIY